MSVVAGLGHGLWRGTLAPLAMGVTIGAYAGRFSGERLLQALGAGRQARSSASPKWMRSTASFFPGRMKAVQMWPRRGWCGVASTAMRLSPRTPHAFEGRDHPRVVGHQDAGAQQTRQVADLQVLERLAGWTSSRRAGPRIGGPQRDALLGEMEVEIGELHEGRGEAHAEAPTSSSARLQPLAGGGESHVQRPARLGVPGLRALLSLFRRQGRDAASRSATF